MLLCVPRCPQLPYRPPSRRCAVQRASGSGSGHPGESMVIGRQTSLNINGLGVMFIAVTRGGPGLLPAFGREGRAWAECPCLSWEEGSDAGWEREKGDSSARSLQCQVPAAARSVPQPSLNHPKALAAHQHGTAGARMLHSPSCATLVARLAAKQTAPSS